jgi:hypothetical protein
LPFTSSKNFAAARRLPLGKQPTTKFPIFPLFGKKVENETLVGPGSAIRIPFPRCLGRRRSRLANSFKFNKTFCHAIVQPTGKFTFFNRENETLVVLGSAI